MTYIVDNYNVDYKLDIVIQGNDRIFMKNQDKTLNFEMLYQSEIENPNIRVSLYKRATKEPADQTYELVDLKDFVCKNLGGGPVYALIDKEGIVVYSVMSPGVLLGLVNGDFSKLRDKVEEVGVDLSKDNQVLIDKLVSKDFDVSMLTNVEMKELERVHSKYMDRNVNGKVTVDSDKSKVLKYAKSLGKKKSVFEL